MSKKKDKKRKRKDEERIARLVHLEDTDTDVVLHGSRCAASSSTTFSRSYVVNDRVRLIAHGNQKAMFAGVTVETVGGGPICHADINACVEILEKAKSWLDEQVRDAGFTPMESVDTFTSTSIGNVEILGDAAFVNDGATPARLVMIDPPESVTDSAEDVAETEMRAVRASSPSAVKAAAAQQAGTSSGYHDHDGDDKGND